MAQPAIDIGITTEADGSVVVDLSTRRATAGKSADTSKHQANLVEALPNEALSSIGFDLYEGVTVDLASRQRWVDNYNEGLKMLGLLIEKPSQITNNTSTVQHPLLGWAIVKFQALTNGEMLPAGGPCKVRNEGPLPETVADALERDMNYYLTTTAVEYYPDTDRGIYYIGYGGCIFKKVYWCPLRRRPVSESVYMPDLIVSNEATTLQWAARITHQVEMSKQRVLQMIDSGWWADVSIGTPSLNRSSSIRAEQQAVGLSPQPTRPQDYQHTIYEVCCTLDLTPWGLGEKDQPEGIQLPYLVTMDRDTKQIYALRRNWKEGDATRSSRRMYVKWGMIPGIGYLDQGFLNLLGNHTVALTALLRILIDAGIYSIFPGGVRVKGLRMDTNEIRPSPGEFQEIETGGQPINNAIMPLPFKGPTADVLALLQHLEQQGEKQAGTIEIQTASGTTNIPVGTMMAAVEQQAQVGIAVHKRLHNAQKEELCLLRDLFVEAGEEGLALLKQRDQTQPYTLEQLGDAGLIPASDPNVPAYVHRFMQATALEQLSTTHPDLYDQREVQEYLLQIGRFPESNRFLRPPAPPVAPPPDPNMLLVQLQERIETAKLQLKAEDQAGRQRLDEMKLQMEMFFKAKESDTKAQTAAAQQAAEDQRAGEQQAAESERERQALLADISQAAADRESRELIAAMGNQTELIKEGIRADAQPTETNPARDNKSGP